METIHIVMATDENFARHAGVALMSLLCTKASANPVAIYILNDGLSEVSRSCLEEIARSKGASIAFPHVDGKGYMDLVYTPEIPAITYYRLAMPDVVSAAKVLYLDCDIIVRKDITELWRTDISGRHLAAAIDFPYPAVYRNIKLLGIAEPLMYFNSGVMLLNLRKCAEDRTMENVVRFARNNPDKVENKDQDALNAVLWDERLSIHPRWNAQSHWFKFALRQSTRSALTPEIVEAIRDPAIVHYSGPYKPWRYMCTTPYRQEYFRYLSMTPWRHIEPESVGLKQVLIKNSKLAIRHIISRQLGYLV